MIPGALPLTARHLPSLRNRLADPMNEMPELSAADAPFASSASLDHLSLLVASGPDARSFLDSQLTRNVPFAGGPASLAGYCSPKGRLLASFVVWSVDDAIHLVLSRDIADAIAKRLRMYVLRAKVVIDDASSRLSLVGVLDPADAAVAAAAPWQVVRERDDLWVRHPDADGRRRFLHVAPNGPARRVDACDAAHWRWLEVRAGLPRVTLATQDRFVPQMLNLEALGGVDFRKGCFPGQEIVARSQYLGKLKRRTALASIAATGAVPSPGTDIHHGGEAEASGLVVNAERGRDGTIALLIELPVARFESTELHVGTADGGSLTLESLPYALPDNEVFVRPKL